MWDLDGKSGFMWDWDGKTGGLAILGEHKLLYLYCCSLQPTCIRKTLTACWIFLFRSVGGCKDYLSWLKREIEDYFWLVSDIKVIC